MMANPVRYLFDTDFAAPPPEPEPADVEDGPEEVPMIELEVHLGELRKAEEASYQRGLGDGETTSVAQSQKNLVEEARRVADAAERMITLFDEELGRMERDATALSVTVARKLAGHLYVHEGHIYELTDRDRRHIHPAVGASTFSGTAEDLRERAKAFESQGVGEIVYAPMGPDVPGELTAMKEALHG